VKSCLLLAGGRVVSDSATAPAPVKPNPVKKRVAQMRREIAEISERNRRCLHGSKRRLDGAVGDHERRQQRLQAIVDELVALTAWEKV
jgi:hypothetical protein